MTSGSVPDRRTIPLLDLITRESLDQDYQHVAARRPAGAPRPPGRGALTGLAVIAFGLIVTVAAVQTSRNAPVDQADKDQLISQVDAARSELAGIQRHIARVQHANTATDATFAKVNAALAQANAREDVLSQEAGFAPASGEGVVVQVTDSPDGSDSGEVRDSDLAALTNGLWTAGATAISVNGHRLTALSALRNSGSVIRLDGTSLSPPYVVTALGDTRTLLARFAQSASGRDFHDVTSTYGMPTSMRDDSDLTVPAAPAGMLSLSYAHTEQQESK